jgi:MFS family permease
VTTAHPWRIVAVAVLAQTLALMDNTILNVALETLGDPARGLAASPTALAWIVDSYSLVLAAGSFAGGALADRYGPRRILIAGLAALAAASLAAAFCANSAELIVCRGLMGAGGALITPATLAIVAGSTTAADRSRAIAVWASSGGLAVAIGPLVGGALLTHFWWGSVFLLNLPVAAIAAAGALFLVPELRHAARRRLDLPGVVLTLLGLGLVVYGVIRGGTPGGLSDPITPVTVLAGLALLALFTFLRLANDNDVDAQPSSNTEVRLLIQPRFTGGATAMLLLFFGLAGQLFYAAFYLQGVRGLSALAAGAVMASAAVGIVLGNQASPTVCRLLSARWCAVAGIVLSSLTFGSYIWFSADTPIAWLVLLLFIQGVGTGLVVSPLTGQTMAAVPPGYAGFGAAVISASRPIGSTLGVAVLGTLLATGYRTAILPTLASVPPTSRNLAAQSAEATRTLARALHRPDLLAAANRAYLHAMDVTALWTAAASLSGALLVIRCLRSQEPALETSRGHRPASLTDTARRG